jgi:translation initiation factor 3 subunit L
LYASLDTRKLAGFLDVNEEEMVCAMMVLKMSGRSISRIGEEGSAAATAANGATKTVSTSTGSLLDGQMITTSDFDFVITEVRIFTMF